MYAKIIKYCKNFSHKNRSTAGYYLLLISLLSSYYSFGSMPAARLLRPESVVAPVGYNNGYCPVDDTSFLLNQLENALDLTIENTFKGLTYCNYIPVFTELTITSSGAYCLNNSIAGTIAINASNVLLDLNSYSISSAAHSITIGANLTNISIKNGVIASTTQEGLLVNQGCSVLKFEDIVFSQCGTTNTYALNFNGVLNNPITNCFVNNIKILSCTGGILCNNTSNILLKNSTVTNAHNTTINGLNAISIQADTPGIIANALIQDCFIGGLNASAGPAQGITITNVANAVIKNCDVQQVTGTLAIGYNFFNAPQTILSNCSACQLIDQGTVSNATGVKGVYVQNSSDNVIENMVIANLSTAFSNAFGIQVLNSPRTIVKNCTCSDIISLDATNYNHYSFGIELNNAPNSSIDKYLCTNISTNGLGAFGFHVLNSPFSTITQGQVNTLNAPQASWGYRIFQNSSNTTLQECTSMNLNVSSAPFLLNDLDGAIGFELETVSNVYVKDCASSLNNAPVAGARSAGFSASTADYTFNVVVDNFYTSTSTALTPTDGNGIYVGYYATNYTLKDCISTHNSGTALIINGPGAIVYDSQCANSVIGIANNAPSSVGLASSTIYNTTMTNCTTGLYNNANTYTIYNCSATGNTTDYGGNTTNLHIVALGGTPVVGNNISG